MVEWHDMAKYRSGRTLDGNERFFIPIPFDEEGFIGRECPSTTCHPKYFKITSNSVAKGNADKNELFCPYCGHKDHVTQFITKDQKEWAISLVERDVVRSFTEMLEDTFRPLNSYREGGLLSIRVEVKPGYLPSVRHYAEKILKRIVNCDQCGGRYAVFGIALFCPYCGGGNIQVHIKTSADIILAFLDDEGRMTEEHGKEAGYHLLGNCVEDSVSLFEGFIKEIYSRRLSTKLPNDKYLDKMNSIKNSFQNLAKAEEIVRRDLGYSLLQSLSLGDRDFLETQFAKRHVITHNLGMVDPKYLEQVSSWQSSGEDVPLNSSEIRRMIHLIEDILIKFSAI